MTSGPPDVIPPSSCDYTDVNLFFQHKRVLWNGVSAKRWGWFARPLAQSVQLCCITDRIERAGFSHQQRHAPSDQHLRVSVQRQGQPKMSLDPLPSHKAAR
jgi:hypothetical protein